MSDRLRLLKNIRALIAERQRGSLREWKRTSTVIKGKEGEDEFPRRSAKGSEVTKGSEKGYMHNFKRQRSRTHNPFSYADSIGPGPRGRRRNRTGKWKCHKIGTRKQLCRNVDTGREMVVSVDPMWKTTYNDEYRKRKFPRRIGGKNLIDPKTAERLDAPPGKEPKGRELSPAAERGRKGTRKSREVSRVVARKRAQTGKQGSLAFESRAHDQHQLLEREMRRPAKGEYWMKGLKIKRNALKKRYEAELRKHHKIRKGVPTPASVFRAPIPPDVWAKIEADKAKLMQKSRDGSLSPDERKHLRQIVLGQTFRKTSQRRQESHDGRIGAHEYLLRERATRKPEYWMGKLDIEKNALKRRYEAELRKHHRIKKGKPTPKYVFRAPIPDEVWAKIEADKDRLMSRPKGSLSDDERRHLKQIVLGMTFRRISRGKTEDRQEKRIPLTSDSDETRRLLNVLREVLR